MLILVGGYFILRPEFCDGLPRDIGACDRDRPAYTGDSCREVAQEWGTHLDERVAEVISGPSSSGGKGRSVLLYDAEILVTQLANKHMRDAGITPLCERDDFLATGAAQLSTSVREEVGGVMYEGNPVVSYEEWHLRLQELVGLILGEPDQPYEPAP